MSEAPKIEFDPKTGKVIPFTPHPIPPVHDERSLRNAERARAHNGILPDELPEHKSDG